MVRKQAIKSKEERAFLLKSNDVFKEELIDRIAKGKDLSLNQYVARSRASNYGQFGYMPMRQGNEPTEEHKSWMAEFNKWSDYNKEYLKQSFNIPDNEYCTGYIH